VAHCREFQRAITEEKDQIATSAMSRKLASPCNTAFYLVSCMKRQQARKPDEAGPTPILHSARSRSPSSGKYMTSTWQIGIRLSYQA